MSAVAILGDPGVLDGVPTVYFNAAPRPETPDATAVLPWRGAHLDANAPAGVLRPEPDGLAPGFAQAVVVAGKERAGVCEDLARAWDLLAVGGRLVLAGDNAVGIRTTVRRVAAALGPEPDVLALRAHARAVAWTRCAGAFPLRPRSGTVPLRLPWGGVDLASAPGVFSAGDVDRGSRLLLESLRGRPRPARALDLCCGIGVLGAGARLLWPDLDLAAWDADARALACARRNLPCADCRWWDVAEGVPNGTAPFDLVLLNPPRHAGTREDPGLPRRIFALLPALLTRHGGALIVTDRRRPAERSLRRWATVAEVARDGGYRVLACDAKAPAGAR